MGKISSYNSLRKKILDISTLEGEFILRSGQKSNHYFDKYLFESQPDLLYQICWQMKHQWPTDYEILAGLETGGIPIATILSQLVGTPTIFVRKEAKTYGTCKLAEGIDFQGKKVCVIEDVITTGGQVIKSCHDLMDHGATIQYVFCVILRDPGGRKNIEDAGLKLYNLFDFCNSI